MADNQFSLRVYSYLDRMQPQYAAFVGTITQGDLPTEGMASLYIEVAPGNEVFRMVDIAVKATEAKPGAQIVEREFGMFEVHSHSQSEVLEAGRIVLDRLSLNPATASSRSSPRCRSSPTSTPTSPSCSTASAAARCWFRVRPCWCWNARLPRISTTPATKPRKAPTSRSCTCLRSDDLAACGCPVPRREIVAARNSAVKALEELDGRPEKG